ncbi:sodium glucose cotransporter 5-like [Paramuricea clavata]|uniref:Sodium glucose cotransporter 5-like n=1 Tax=Paramuricea clavata TaxID=317549 RepID=A0A7D9EHK5_PARCT|nr:sodium glucose cotransporter 5-like [Paramuricea clavata]
MRTNNRRLVWEDWLAIAIYFVFTIGLGLAVKFRRGRRQESTESFFLAGRSLVWWMVGGSIFASNIGGTHFIGIAGDGAATGIAVICYEWQASWTLLILGYFFVPVYLTSGIYTMPEYMQKRYQSQSIRTILTFITLVSYVFTKISIDIYAGSVYFREATGWNIYISAFVVLSITAVYVIVGGLEAVTFTDILQVSIMLIGAIILTILGFIEIGGLEKLWEEYPKSFGRNWRTMENVTVNGTISESHGNSSSCYGLTPYWANMFRPFDDPDFPWFGLWFALPIVEIWYWCTDQVMVQRALAAKSVVHAKGGTIFAGFLKILPMFIMVFPGMISRVLYKDDVACPDAESCERACGNKLGCSNLAYPR